MNNNIENFALKDITCRRCHKPFAASNGNDILFGGVKVPGRPTKLSFTCPFCQNIIHWVKNCKQNGYKQK